MHATCPSDLAKLSYALFLAPLRSDLFVHPERYVRLSKLLLMSVMQDAVQFMASLLRKVVLSVWR
jgi:hypothetical protein